MVEYLQPRDLPAALAWVARQETRHEMPRRFAEIADSIMLRAWSHLDRPGVLAAFVKVALERILHLDAIAGNLDDQPAFGDLLLQDDGKRRRVLEALVPLLPDPEHNWSGLVYSPTPLVINTDLCWLIERLGAAESEQAKDLWSRLIGKVISWSDARQVNAVLTACQDEPALAKVLAWLVTPIKLDSDLARSLKAEHYLAQERRQRAEKASIHPFPMEELRHWFERFEAGELFAWCNVVVLLSFDSKSGRYGQVFDADLTSQPGWEAIDAPTRARAQAAARRYLLEQQPQPVDWIATGEFYHSDLAAYKALHLLWQEARAFVSSLDGEVWRRWAPMVLAFRTSSSSDDERVQQALVKETYRRAPAEVEATLLQLIDEENTQQGHLFITRKLTLCWDEPLTQGVLAKVQDPTLTPAAMGDLLEELVKHYVPGATTFAASLLALPLPQDGVERERACVAARVLLGNARGAGWSSIWPVIQHDTAFGRALVEGVAHSGHWGTANLQELTEDQLADLFLWLVRQYPPAEDPQVDGFHAVDPRESVAHWRNSVLEHLKGRGTQRAVVAIQRLVQELPELPWLKWTLVNAKAATRRRTWIPPAPADILALAVDPRKRLVQEGRELLAVLVESLHRLQVKLHGETPAVASLWNEWKQGRKTLYRPKDEERFSDFVKMHLDEDLRGRVVVNREVQIRRGEGGTPGERTDIHVDAIRRLGPTSGDYDTITAIIEVKGNWHRELFTAMETQLVGRYLRDNQAQHGLYLVGWFTCPQWDTGDSRKRSLPKMSIEEARECLEQQATGLSRDGRQIVAVVLDTGLRG